MHKSIYLETKITFNSGEYLLERYPKTEDKSLRAWSNAELLLLDYIKDSTVEDVHLFNDRFGVWNTLLNTKNITTVWTYASQQKAIHNNLLLNNLSTDVLYKSPLDGLEEVGLALMKVPKSLELFELFLSQIHRASDSNTEVVCCFMTKYFSVSYLKVASKYFEDVTQTKAWKKSRLLVLKRAKDDVEVDNYVNSISWKGRDIKQYYGVFSSSKIDVGTQFLLNNFTLNSEEEQVLDLASGNGVIASDILKMNAGVHLTLMDDFNLAVESSKMNLVQSRASFICSDSLVEFSKGYYDVVVSNPPFHFEFETNIDITLSLFKGVKECLKAEGRFVLVANRHLNYKTHLERVFSLVSEVAVNDKFVVYECLS